MGLREDLNTRWNVHSVTLYDKPPEWNFKLLTVEEQHVFHRALLEMDHFKQYWEDRNLYSRDPEIENSTEGNFLLQRLNNAIIDTNVF